MPNQHRAGARWHKAHALVRILQDRNISSLDAIEFGELDWRLLAVQAKLRPPSTFTQGVAVGILRERETNPRPESWADQHRSAPVGTVT